MIQNARNDDPKTFYIMKNMVSNNVFRQFAQADPEAVKKSQWRLGALANQQDVGVGNPDLPTFRVSVEEAHYCAVWLGGLLPTKSQWDKAAGRHPDDHADAIGPFKMPWNENDPQQIAVDVQRGNQRGPLPIGTATHDISPFGIRDMAANGQEYTRDIEQGSGVTSTETVPLENVSDSATVIIMSTSYTAPRPLAYEEMEKPPLLSPYRTPLSRTELYADPETGFRVVLEIEP